MGCHCSRAVGSGTGERRDKPAWRRDMRTSYIEGVAIHDDLESCVGAREDAGEALTEGDVGWVIEPRNHLFGVPTPSQWSEGNIAGRAIASCQRTCLLYTSDAADDLLCVDLGGRRIIKKKKNNQIKNIK